MKHLITLAILIFVLPHVATAQTHLDIMVPDIKDTDLKGPVKSVMLKLCQNAADIYIWEKREFDRTGNLTFITEYDDDMKLMNRSEFIYDDNGCYVGMKYKDEEHDFESDWKVVLNPETRQIARQEKTDGRIGIETYSPEGYLVSYRLMGKNHEQIVATEYKRDEHNRKTRRTRIEGRKPVYTFFYKWADNGFIDMEGQIYQKDKAKRRHTYEYLVVDKYGNWTQRIMVRYNIDGREPVWMYEHTVVRTIAYYEPAEATEEATTDDAKKGEAADAAETSLEQ